MTFDSNNTTTNTIAITTTTTASIAMMVALTGFDTGEPVEIERGVATLVAEDCVAWLCFRSCPQDGHGRMVWLKEGADHGLFVPAGTKVTITKDSPYEAGYSSFETMVPIAPQDKEEILSRWGKVLAAKKAARKAAAAAYDAAQAAKVKADVEALKPLVSVLASMGIEHTLEHQDDQAVVQVPVGRVDAWGRPDPMTVFAPKGRRIQIDGVEVQGLVLAGLLLDDLQDGGKWEVSWKAHCVRAAMPVTDLLPGFEWKQEWVRYPFLEMGAMGTPRSHWGRSVSVTPPEGSVGWYIVFWEGADERGALKPKYDATSATSVASAIREWLN